MAKTLVLAEKPSVGKDELVSGGKRRKDGRMVEGDEGQILFLLAHPAEDEPVALEQGYLPFRKDAYAYLGTRQVLHDGQRAAKLLFDLPDAADHITEKVRVAVGKIKAENRTASLCQLEKRFPLIAGRTYGGNDFCTHAKPSHGKMLERTPGSALSTRILCLFL